MSKAPIEISLDKMEQLKQTVKPCRQHTDILKKENFYGHESKEGFSVERKIKFSHSVDKIMYFFKNYRLISVL